MTTDERLEKVKEIKGRILPQIDTYLEYIRQEFFKLFSIRENLNFSNDGCLKPSGGTDENFILFNYLVNEYYHAMRIREAVSFPDWFMEKDIDTEYIVPENVVELCSDEKFDLFNGILNAIEYSMANEDCGVGMCMAPGMDAEKSYMEAISVGDAMEAFNPGFYKIENLATAYDWIRHNERMEKKRAETGEAGKQFHKKEDTE